VEFADIMLEMSHAASLRGVNNRLGRGGRSKRPNHFYTNERIPNMLDNFESALNNFITLPSKPNRDLPTEGGSQTQTFQYDKGERQMPDLSSYPLMGAADHQSFCERKLIELGIDGEYFADVATDRTLQLDYDYPYELPLSAQFFETLEIFARLLTVDSLGNPLSGGTIKYATYRRLKSRNGRTHVIITTSWDIPQAERIAWQAAFGSDFKREALSLAYAAQGQRSPVLLYSRKREWAWAVSTLIMPPANKA